MNHKSETILEESFAKQIKLIENNDQFIIEKQFYQHHNIEIYNLLKKNSHPNICPIFEVMQESDHFTVLEAYLGKQTLNDLIPLTNMHLFYRYITQLCDALIHLHKLNIVHRDLKPENIFIVNGKLVLNDFDISKQRVDSHQRKDTHVLGSVGFASPEQYGFSRSDARSDIYSLGIVINLMITGDFISETYISGNLKYIVDRCVQIDPEDRYQSVQEVKEELMIQERGGSRFTLPGFRSNTKRNKIIAWCVYPVLLMVVLVAETQGETQFIDHIKSKVVIALVFTVIIAVCFNYLNIRRVLPRSIRRRPVLATLILLVLGLITIVIIYALFLGIIDIMLAAYQ